MVNIFKDKKFLKECAIILVVGIIVNGLCFLMGTIHSKAATSSGQLPFVISSNQPTYNTWWSDYIKNTITQESLWVSHVDSDDYVLIIPRSYYSYDSHIRFYCYINPVFRQNIDVSTFDYYNATLTLECTEYIRIDVTPRSQGAWAFNYNYFHENYDNTFLGPIVDTGNSFVNNQYGFRVTEDYPVALLGTNEILNSVTGDSMIVNSVTDISSTEFNPSDALEITDIIGHNFSNLPTVPSPSFDSSLSIVENVKNFFSWLGSLIANLFSNLVDNLITFFNALIQAINNGFNNVYQNFKSLFQPFIDSVIDFFDSATDFFDNVGQWFLNIVTRLGDIFGKIGSLYDKIDGFIDYVKAPLDMDAINTAWVGSAIGGSFTTYYTQTLIVKGLFDSLSNISAPNSLSFTVDFSNAPSPFDTVGSVTFNFDWYENIRYIVTPLISAFIIFGCVMHLIQTLPSIIQGSGSAAEQYQLHNGGITTITMSDRVGTKAHSVTTSTRRRI